MAVTRPIGVVAVTLGLAAVLFSVSATLAPVQGQAPASAAPARGSIEATQARLEQVPGDWTAWVALGDAHVRAAVANADPAQYQLAEKAYEKSLQVKPDDNALALTGQATLAASRHDFKAALELARKSQTLNSYSPANQGILVDALVELGRYEDAAVELQRMLELRPGVASLARASYYQELHGDIPNAQASLEEAEKLASQEVDVLYAIQYLGELAFAHGDPETALEHYNRGLVLKPGDAGFLAARGEVRAALGDLEGALADYEASVTKLPEPAHIAEYAATLELAGDDAAAAVQHQKVREQYEALRAAGSNIDLDLSVYEASQGNAEAALEAAEREYARRQSVHTEDALAYALHLLGRNEEALPHAVAAEALSGEDGTIAYHRGLIEKALGLPEADATLERAVRINPHSADGKAAAALLGT